MGVDFAKMKAIPSTNYFTPFKEGYHSESFSFGFKVEQQLSYSTFLSLTSVYSEKMEGVWDRGFIPIRYIEFKIIDNSVQFNWMLHRLFHFGAGPYLRYIPKTYIYRGFEHTYFLKLETNSNRTDLGARFKVGYFYKNFLLETYYNQGIVTLTGEEKASFKPLNSFGISLSYMFKILNKKQKSRRDEVRKKRK